MDAADPPLATPPDGALLSESSELQIPAVGIKIPSPRDGFFTYSEEKALQSVRSRHAPTLL